jgi:uncharacterized membrane protein YhaH (DUF805 family)
MNLGHLLFSFDGRISRKTYIVAVSLLAIAMSALMFSISALATGSWLLVPARPEGVQTWLMIYGVVVLVGMWPTLALLAKRLHDRNYPTWVGVAFYLAMLILIIPLAWFGPAYFQLELLSWFRAYILLFVLLYWPISFWFAAQSMFMRGIVGPNAWGADPLVGRALPGYEPPTFWNVVFNPDGRMGRRMWWLIFVSVLVLFVGWFAVYGIAMRWAIPQGATPEWLKSAEGRSAVTAAALPIVIPLMLLFYLMNWAAFAAGTKRLHDRGRSGWVLASYYVPFALLLIAGLLSEHERALYGGTGPAELMRWVVIAAALMGGGLTLWLFVELGFLRGQPHENAYGPDPQIESA